MYIPIQEGLEPIHCAVIGNRSYLLGFLIDEYDTEPDAQTKVHVASFLCMLYIIMLLLWAPLGLL